MKKISLIFLSFFLFYAAAFAQQNGVRILVLGTQGRNLSEIEDRILREQVMRECLALEIGVVSVMALEGAVQQDGADLRNLSLSQRQYFAARFGADWCISGSIEAGLRSDQYCLTVDDMKTGKSYSAEIPLKKNVPFSGYADELAKKIASMARERVYETK